MGKPQFYPKMFDIDISVCMSCQICVEVCPFEAIKMDKEFELSQRERFDHLLLRKEQLSKSNGYYHKIHPVEAEAVDKSLADAAAAAEAKKKAAAEAAAKAAAAKAAALQPLRRNLRQADRRHLLLLPKSRDARLELRRWNVLARVPERARHPNKLVQEFLHATGVSWIGDLAGRWIEELSRRAEIDIRENRDEA